MQVCTVITAQDSRMFTGFREEVNSDSSAGFGGGNGCGLLLILLQHGLILPYVKGGFPPRGRDGMFAPPIDQLREGVVDDDRLITLFGKERKFASLYRGRHRALA